MGRGTRQDGETAAGQVLAGRYELRELIGVGAAARVYLARDNHLGRDDAVKMLTHDAAADPDFAERFRREAKAIASFSHPNIVTIYDWGTSDGLDYMVMEYVPGGSLSELLAQQGRVPEDQALRLAAGTAQALAAAHARGIVHRDIKPDNILLAPDGSPKVADFGIAWVPGLSHLTLTNAIFGTVSYISPEQARGDTVDGRSDLYSLGVVLYRMLTGRLPFEGGSTVDVAVRHVQEEPQPPRSIRRDISPEAERIVLKAMAKRPADRYQSATAMAEALDRARALNGSRRGRARRATAESTIAAPVGLVRESVPRRRVDPRTRRPSPWARLLWAIPAALLALVVVALALAVRPWAGPPAHRSAGSGHAGRPAATAPPHRAGTAAPSRHRGAASSHPTAVPTATRSRQVSPPAGGHPAATRPTATLPNQPQPAAPSQATGGSPPSVGASSPQGAVTAFYDDVASHRFADAASLWSPSLKLSDPPSVYIDQRFANTRSIWVDGVSLQGSNPPYATVGVRVTETVGPAGATQVFTGSWQLVQQNGRWLLNWPNLQSVSSAELMVQTISQGEGQGNGKAKGHGKHGQD